MGAGSSCLDYRRLRSRRGLCAGAPRGPNRSNRGDPPPIAVSLQPAIYGMSLSPRLGPARPAPPPPHLGGPQPPTESFPKQQSSVGIALGPTRPLAESFPPTCDSNKWSLGEEMAGQNTLEFTDAT